MSEDSIRILESNEDSAEPGTATPPKGQGRGKDKGLGRGSGRSRVKSGVKSQMQPLLNTIRPRPRSYVQLIDSHGKMVSLINSRFVLS
jgi:hypothetical protein